MERCRGITVREIWQSPRRCTDDGVSHPRTVGHFGDRLLSILSTSVAILAASRYLPHFKLHVYSFWNFLHFPNLSQGRVKPGPLGPPLTAPDLGKR